ncbi:MAG: hypothetical protein KAT29_15685 [Anaerolineales bacterium]|nr:hypothetical protein [Anaerolineales bacterium]
MFSNTRSTSKRTCHLITEAIEESEYFPMVT